MGIADRRRFETAATKKASGKLHLGQQVILDHINRDYPDSPNDHEHEVYHPRNKPRISDYQGNSGGQGHLARKLKQAGFQAQPKSDKYPILNRHHLTRHFVHPRTKESVHYEPQADSWGSSKYAIRHVAPFTQ